YIRRNLKDAQAMLAETYVLHDPSLPEFRGGPAGWRAAQERYQGSISDYRLTVLTQFAQEHEVVTRWKAEGVHTGALLGIPATRRLICVTGITITRVRDGKIIEEFQNWDTEGLLRQLAGPFRPVTPPPRFGPFRGMGPMPRFGAA